MSPSLRRQLACGAEVALLRLSLPAPAAHAPIAASLSPSSAHPSVTSVACMCLCRGRGQAYYMMGCRPIRPQLNSMQDLLHSQNNQSSVHVAVENEYSCAPVLLCLRPDRALGRWSAQSFASGHLPAHSWQAQRPPWSSTCSVAPHADLHYSSCLTCASVAPMLGLCTHARPGLLSSLALISMQADPHHGLQGLSQCPGVSAACLCGGPCPGWQGRPAAASTCSS